MCEIAAARTTEPGNFFHQPQLKKPDNFVGTAPLMVLLRVSAGAFDACSNHLYFVTFLTHFQQSYLLSLRPFKQFQPPHPLPPSLLFATSSVERCTTIADPSFTWPWQVCTSYKTSRSSYCGAFPASWGIDSGYRSPERWWNASSMLHGRAPNSPGLALPAQAQADPRLPRL